MQHSAITTQCDAEVGIKLAGVICCVLCGMTERQHIIVFDIELCYKTCDAARDEVGQYVSARFILSRGG